MQNPKIVTAKSTTALKSKFGVTPDLLVPLTLLRTQGSERSLGQYKLVDGDRLIKRFNSFKEFKYYSDGTLHGTGRHVVIQKGNEVQDLC